MFDLDTEDVAAQLQGLCAYRFTIDEAVRTLVRKACADADLGRADVDDATRDAWVAETASQPRERLEAFEPGDAPFGDQAWETYDGDVSGLVEAIEALSGTVGE